jgi:hypothetical protein
MSRRTNPLIIETARSLYLKYGGENHRQIEREMHQRGCEHFTRRVFYNQRKADGTIRPGWIEKYGWKEELASTIGNAERNEQASDPLAHPTVTAASPLYLRKSSAFPATTQKIS